MQTKTKLIGAAAACGACCAVSILPAVLAGGGLAAIGGAAFAGDEIFVTVLVFVAAGAFLFWRKSNAIQKAAEACRCGGTCGAADRPDPSCALPTK